MIFDSCPCVDGVTDGFSDGKTGFVVDTDGTSDGFGGTNVVVETGVVAHSDNVSPPTGRVVVGPGVTKVSVSGGITPVVVVSTVVSTTGSVCVCSVVTVTSSDGTGTVDFSVGPSDGTVGGTVSLVPPVSTVLDTPPDTVSPGMVDFFVTGIVGPGVV